MRHPYLFVAAFALPVPLPALASVAAEADGGWSVGAGVALGRGYTAGVVASLGGMGGLHDPPGASVPAGQVLVEYRLAPALALMFDATAHHFQPDGDAGWSQSGVGGSAGLRWVINAGRPVEVSGYGVLGGSWSHAEGPTGVYRAGEDPETLPAEGESGLRGVGVGLGLALETALLDALWLRLSSDVARADLHRVVSSTTVSDGTRYEEEHAGLSAVLAMRPSLQLRLVF